MLPCLALLLLTGLPACTVAADKKLALGGTEVESLVTVTLEEGVVPSIQLQLQEVKRDKASQFFPLMGKQAGGIPPIQPKRKMGLVVCACLGSRCRDEEAGMNTVLPKIQNYLGEFLPKA